MHQLSGPLSILWAEKGCDLLQYLPGVNLIKHAFLVMDNTVHPFPNSGRICYGLALGFNMTDVMSFWQRLMAKNKQTHL